MTGCEAMDYNQIRSHDAKWANVRVGQYAVVRLDNDGDVVMVYSVEDSKPMAIAFARALGIGSAVLLHRATESQVDTVPY